jgi:hypothetical protein
LPSDLIEKNFRWIVAFLRTALSRHENLSEGNSGWKIFGSRAAEMVGVTSNDMFKMLTRWILLLMRLPIEDYQFKFDTETFEVSFGGTTTNGLEKLKNNQVIYYRFSLFPEKNLIYPH